MSVQQANMMQQGQGQMGQGQGMQGQGQMQPGMQAAAPQGPQTMVGKVWNWGKRMARSEGTAAMEYRAKEAEKDKVNAVNRYNDAKTKCATSIEEAHKLATTVLAPTNSVISEDINNITAPLKTPATFNMIGAQAPVQGNVALAPGAIENQTAQVLNQSPTENPQGQIDPNVNAPIQPAAASLSDVQGTPDVVLKAKLSEYFQQQGVVDINGKSLDPEMIGRGISDLKFNNKNNFNANFYLNGSSGEYKTAEQIIAEPELLNQIKTNALEIANGGWSTANRGIGVTWGGKRKSKKSQKKQAKRKTCSGGKKNKSKKQKKCNGGKKSKRRQRK